MRTLVAGVAVAAAALGPGEGRARADGSDTVWAAGDKLGGRPWQLVLSAERVTGVSLWRAKGVPAGGTTDSRGVAWSGVLSTSDTGIFGPMPYGIARLTTDVVLPARFSAGIGIGDSGTSASSSGSEVAHGSTFICAPRFGYMLPLSDRLVVWPRVGATYYAIATKGIDGSELLMNGLALTAEFAVTFAVVRHFVLFATPALDAGVLGGATRKQPGVADVGGSGILSQLGVAVGGAGYL